MKPVEFEEQNFIIPATNETVPVPLFVTPGSAAACFEVSEEEIEIIGNTKKIWVIVNGSHWPPMAITAAFPISKQVDFPEELDEEEN